MWRRNGSYRRRPFFPGPVDERPWQMSSLSRSREHACRSFTAQTPHKRLPLRWRGIAFSPLEADAGRRPHSRKWLEHMSGCFRGRGAEVALPQGDVLRSRVQIDRVLGEGGMCVVYGAEASAARRARRREALLRPEMLERPRSSSASSARARRDHAFTASTSCASSILSARSSGPSTAHSSWSICRAATLRTRSCSTTVGYRFGGGRLRPPGVRGHRRGRTRSASSIATSSRRTSSSRSRGQAPSQKVLDFGIAKAARPRAQHYGEATVMVAAALHGARADALDQERRHSHGHLVTGRDHPRTTRASPVQGAPHAAGSAPRSCRIPPALSSIRQDVPAALEGQRSFAASERTLTIASHTWAMSPSRSPECRVPVRSRLGAPDRRHSAVIERPSAGRHPGEPFVGRNGVGSTDPRGIG